MGLYTVLYQAAVFYFEDTRVTLTKALLTVVESFTTTGYGEDSGPWTSTPVQLLLTAMQVTGVSLVFLALPVFLAPWVEERLPQVAPTASTSSRPATNSWWRGRTTVAAGSTISSSSERTGAVGQEPASAWRALSTQSGSETLTSSMANVRTRTSTRRVSSPRSTVAW